MRSFFRKLFGRVAGPPVDLSKLTPLFSVEDDGIYVIQVGSDGDIALCKFNLVGESDAAFNPISIWDGS